MKHYKFNNKNLWVGVVAWAFLAIPNSLNAEIITLTDINSLGGVDNVTRDTDSGLEWLDWSASANRTFDDVSGHFGLEGDFEGWRYAARSEVNGLFSALGLPVDNFPSLSRIVDDGTSGENALELLGVTSRNAFFAVTADEASDSSQFAASISWTPTSRTTFVDAVAVVDVDRALTNTGHVLVRAVPEPGGCLLLLLGLLCSVRVVRHSGV